MVGEVGGVDSYDQGAHPLGGGGGGGEMGGDEPDKETMVCETETYLFRNFKTYSGRKSSVNRDNSSSRLSYVCPLSKDSPS